MRLAHAPIAAPPESELCCSFAQFDAIDLQKLQHKADSLLWDGIVDGHHYLRHVALSGAQIRYLITADMRLVGAIGFAVAALTPKARDRRVGWDRQ